MSSSHDAGLPQQSAYLVYLNGIEVPCPSVSVSYGVWAIPEATLSFTPHWLLHRLGAEDRVEVVIFFLDTLSNPEETPKFRLLFEGELLGWSYANSMAGRVMSFNAIADISIFATLAYHFLSNVDAVAAHQTDPGADAGSVAQAGAFGPFFLFKKGLLTQSTSSTGDAPDVTRPFDILFNAVRGMVDSRIPTERRAVPAVNFFARWTRKRNFINRFFALPLFEDDASSEGGVFPILKSAQAASAMQALQSNIGGGMATAGSIWEVLREVFSTVLCEVQMLPTAPLARVRLSDGTVLGDADTAPSTNAPNTEPLRLLNYCVKPQLMFGMAPTCNVFFPSTTDRLTYSESYAAQPTRTYVNDSFISQALAQNYFTTAALTFGFPPEVDAVLQRKMGAPASSTAAAQRAAAQFSGKNLLVFPEEFFKGPVLHRMPIPAWFTHLKNTEPRTSSSATGEAEAADTAEAGALHQLMQEYVAYEHYRARYDKRGGALDTNWNPFAVPGFPCVILDQTTSGMHLVGYLTTVTQSLSSSGTSTSVAYSLGRTLPEMLELLQREAATSKRLLGAAPLEPVPSVRAIIQDFDKAEQFYNALFFQRRPMVGGKKASFDFRETLGYANERGGVDALVFENAVAGVSVAADSSGSSSYDAFGLTGTVPTQVSNLTGEKPVVAQKWFEPIMKSYATAMEYVARPICSLEDYVRFLHGGRRADDPVLTGSESDDTGERSAQVIAADDDRFGSDVVWFKRIRRLRQGPGDFPGAAERGVDVNDQGVTVYDGKLLGTSNDAQTRADWDSVLLDYRAEMYDREGPLE